MTCVSPPVWQGAGEGERQAGETGEEDHHRYQEDCQDWADGEWARDVLNLHLTSYASAV